MMIKLNHASSTATAEIGHFGIIVGKAAEKVGEFADVLLTDFTQKVFSIVQIFRSGNLNIFKIT